MYSFILVISITYNCLFNIAEISITVIPGLKWLPFFFYLTALILTKTIDVKHVDVNAHPVTKTYFLRQPLFKTKVQMPCKSKSLSFFH